MRSIKRDHVRLWKTALLSAPSRKDADKKLRPATAQKLLSSLRSVLEWAVEQGIIESNPAHRVYRVAALDAKAYTEDERRLPFDVEQARDILKKLPEDGPMRWLWLVGLYSGMRLGEVSGLRMEDVREIEGILCFDVVPHDKRGLKTKSSRRVIPVHPKIVVAGFTREVLLFKSKAHYLGRAANAWLRENVTRDPRLSYHSTRHSFKTACRRAGISEEISDALTGHSNRSVGRTYGVMPLKVLAEAMAKISY